MWDWIGGLDVGGFFCPVLWACPGGWLVVMPWAEQPHLHGGAPEFFEWMEYELRRQFESGVVIEMMKSDNVGWCRGRWMVLDFGSL